MSATPRALRSKDAGWCPATEEGPDEVVDGVGHRSRQDHCTSALSQRRSGGRSTDSSSELGLAQSHCTKLGEENPKKGWGGMKVSILDDYFDTLRTLECFAKLAGHDVTVWNDHTEDVDELARACATPRPWSSSGSAPRFGRPLLERLPKLRADQPAERLSAHRHRHVHRARDRGVVRSPPGFAVVCNRRADVGARHRRRCAGFPNRSRR